MYSKKIFMNDIFSLVIVFSLSCFWELAAANKDGGFMIKPLTILNLPEGNYKGEANVPELSLVLAENDENSQKHSSKHNIMIEDLATSELPSEILQPLALTQTSALVSQDTESSVKDFESDSLKISKEPIKVQKCCQPQQVLKLGQFDSECVDVEEDFVIDVFWANRTHYWNYTKSTGNNVTVVARNPCNQSRYILDPKQDENDTFHLLHNSSLYVPYTMNMLGLDEYCVDIIMTSSSILTTAVICTTTPKTEFFHYIFGIGLGVSFVCLMLLAVYSVKRSDIDDDHKKCLAFFSGTMATSFFFILISDFIRLPDNFNILIVYIVYYLKLKYFIWLTLLCYDTYRCVKNATDDVINRESYLKRYLCAATLIPLVFVSINLIDKYNPALPNLYLQFSYSSNRLWNLLLFYIPTAITGVLNIFILCSIVLPQGKCKDFNEFITYMRSEKWRPKPAPENIFQLKNMYRRTCFVCFLVLFFLLLDVIIFLQPNDGKQELHFFVRDVVYCLQGLFISCVFIRKEWCRKKKPKKLDTTETELKLLSNGDKAV